VAITVARMAEVDFTLPFTESGWSMVVPVQSQTSTGMFFFLKPFNPGLWVVSLAAFIFIGFVIWVIEHRINPEFRGTPMQQFGTIFHYAFSTLVFAHRTFPCSPLLLQHLFSFTKNSCLDTKQFLEIY
jgi:glutamate receptor, ionotropic, plant